MSMNRFGRTCRIFTSIGLVCTAAAISLVLSAPARAQTPGLRTELFREADEAWTAARAARVEILSPTSYAKADKLYRRAEENLTRGRNIEDIRKDLLQTMAHLQDGIESARLAEVTLAAPLDARSDALMAEAPQYAEALWTDANKKLADAATALEDGDVKKSQKRGDEARLLFREAELDAIKANFFEETRVLLAKAEKERVKKYAPETLALSENLLAEAESALNRDRYDTDLPRTLAREAKYEARHAFHIAKLSRDIDKKDATVERLVLASEIPLRQIAAVVDVVAGFDAGYEVTAKAIVDGIEVLQSRNHALGQDVLERDRRVGDLWAQLDELEAKLGGASAERLAMEERIRAEERVRDRFARLEKHFTREEGQVLRQREDIIIRLVGVQFAVGKAVIEPRYFAVLTKVQEAIRLFPGSRVRIEGHTDSYGTDEHNLELSMARADAVRQYLLANMQLDPGQVEAVGLGETHPIANNETNEGRARNRRIDLIVTPDLASIAP
ncbi:MAG: OmpA family protein [Candidatus Eisenbacteria bacterium]